MTITENKNNDNNFSKFEVFGKYQTLQYCLICLSTIMISMTHVNYVFIADNVNYRCRVPECESYNATVDIPIWWPLDNNSKCIKPILNTEKYSSDNNSCSKSSFFDVLEECHEWIYENNNSIVAELNLGCQPWKVSLVGTIHNAGMIVSMMFAGWLGDKIGRKPATIICSVGASVGVIKMFLTNYNTYLVVEFLESVMGSGLYTVGVVLMIEVGGNSKSVLTIVLFSYAIYSGELLFAFLAMGLQYWKWLVLALYAPMMLFITYTIILRESTRWQILRGKVDSAKKTLKIIAKMNKIAITENEIMNATDDELRLKFTIEEQKQSEGLKAIFGSREIMTRIAVTSFCFFTSSFLYYGTIVHSVLLPGNKHTNFVLSALTSFPGDVIAYLMMNNMGRKITLQCGYILTAIFLIAQSYAPESIAWLNVVLFLVGKLGVVICFTGIYTYSLELFPTSVRGSLLGCGNTAARVGSMLAPLTPLLMTEVTALPSILFSCTAVIAALLLIFTPETKTLPMFDTIAQVEMYNSVYTTKL